MKTSWMLLAITSLLLLCLCGCKAADLKEKDEKPEKQAEQMTEQDEDPVEIIVPLSLLGVEDASAFDINAYVVSQGFLSGRVDDKGSMHLSMTQEAHKKLLDSMEERTTSVLNTYVNSNDTPYTVKEISHTPRFEGVTMLVDSAEYKEYMKDSALDTLSFAINFTGYLYQTFTEEGITGTLITIKDAETGEELHAADYGKEADLAIGAGIGEVPIPANVPAE